MRLTYRRTALTPAVDARRGADVALNSAGPRRHASVVSPLVSGLTASLSDATLVEPDLHWRNDPGAMATRGLQQPSPTGVRSFRSRNRWPHA